MLTPLLKNKTKSYNKQVDLRACSDAYIILLLIYRIIECSNKVPPNALNSWPKFTDRTQSETGHKQKPVVAPR
jgi:hypothetical protein